ncbi:MAG: hypothetical protein K2O46_01475 [Bacteroidales bacterium]|nr:hypothetical protein [Bacteroidales bacterium]MDE7102904.1 hypothetical protein [Bacteroidales bacterium]
MRKLLLFLLPALLLTACKDPEDTNAINAKSLVGTYKCTRRGTIFYYKDTSLSPTITSPIDYTYDATITYLGDNRVQLDMGGIFTGSVGTYNGVGNAIVFDTYTASDSTELLNVTFNINMDGFYGVGYSGLMEIHLDETYSGTAQGPEITYKVYGNGETHLIKK